MKILILFLLFFSFMVCADQQAICSLIGTSHHKAAFGTITITHTDTADSKRKKAGPNFGFSDLNLNDDSILQLRKFGDLDYIDDDIGQLFNFSIPVDKHDFSVPSPDKDLEFHGKLSVVGRSIVIISNSTGEIDAACVVGISAHSEDMGASSDFMAASCVIFDQKGKQHTFRFQENSTALLVDVPHEFSNNSFLIYQYGIISTALLPINSSHRGELQYNFTGSSINGTEAQDVIGMSLVVDQEGEELSCVIGAARLDSSTTGRSTTGNFSTSGILLTSVSVTSAPVTSAPVTSAPVTSASITSSSITSAALTSGVLSTGSARDDGNSNQISGGSDSGDGENQGDNDDHGSNGHGGGEYKPPAAPSASWGFVWIVVIAVVFSAAWFVVKNKQKLMPYVQRILPFRRSTEYSSAIPVELSDRGQSKPAQTANFEWKDEEGW